MYTIAESKDCNSVTVCLDASTACLSAATHDGLHHSDVGSDIHRPASDHGAQCPKESRGKHLASFNIPAFQAMRPFPIESASNPILVRQTQSDNVVPADRCPGTKEGSTPHQSSGITKISTLEDVSCLHKAPHIAVEGGGSSSSGDELDQVGNAQQSFTSQEQQQQGSGEEEQKQDKPPGLVSVCHSSQDNTPEFSVSGTGAELVGCFCSAQQDEQGLIEHSTDQPTKEENMSTGDLCGAITTSPPHLSPSSTICPTQDALPFACTTGSSHLPQPTLAGFQDDGDTTSQQPGLQHMPAIAYDRSSYYKTKQVPPFTSEDAPRVTMNKTQEQRLLGYGGTFLVESDEHGVCLLNTTASSISTSVGSIDSDWMPTTGCDSEQFKSPNGDSARETSTKRILESWGCSVTNSYPTMETHDNKQEPGQSGTCTNTNASVCGLEECKQTNTPCSSSQKCFDLDPASLAMPRESSDSSRAIAPAASSDSRPCDGPLPLTMPMAVTMDKPLIAVALISEGNGDIQPKECGEVEHIGANLVSDQNA